MANSGAPALECLSCPICGSTRSVTLFIARDRMLGKPGKFPVTKCSCGLVYLNPRPSPEAISSYYPDEYYPLDSEPSLEAHGAACHMLGVLESWLRDKHIEKPKLLDVGCGTGLFLHLAEESGMQVQGIEFSESAAAYGRGRFGLDIFSGPMEAAELPEAYFDIITMSQVLEHLSDPVTSLRRLARSLKAGGLIFLSLPNFQSYEARMFGKRWYSLDAPRHLFQFTPETVSITLEAAGMKPVRIVQSCGTAGLVYSLMGDLTGVSLKFLHHPISEKAYRRIADMLHRLSAPLCSLAARMGKGGAIEVYATRKTGQ